MDITELKEAEESLRESEEHFRKMTEAAFDGFFIAEKGTILEANQKCADLFGYGLEELIGMNAIDLTAPESRHLVLNNIQSGYDKAYELMGLKKDASTFSLEAQGITLQYKGRPARLTVLRDITERKQAEEVLRKSESLLQAILYNSPTVIYMKDKQGRHIFINRKFANLFHVGKEEFIGKTVYDVFPKEMADPIHVNDQKVLKGGAPIQIEEDVLQDDGIHTYISIKFPMHDERGVPYAVCGISTDITERKLADNILLENELKYRTLFENANDAIYLFDPETAEIIDCNEKAAEMDGYTLEELKKKTLSDLHPEDEIESLPDIFKEVDDKGSITGLTGLHHKRKDGELVSIDINASSIELGEKKFVLAIARNITERERSESAIRNIAVGVSAEIGETFFRKLLLHLAKLFDADYAFVALLSEDGFDTVTTLAFCAHGEIVDNMSYNLAGTPCANVMGQHPCAYSCKVQQQFPKDLLLAEMGVDSYMGTPLFDSSGKPLGILVVLDSKPMERIEQMDNIMGIFAARTAAELERMRTEEALRESEERFHKAFQASPDSVTITRTEDGRLIEVNSGFERVTGFSRKEVLGKTTLEIGLWQRRDDRLRLTELLLKEGMVRDLEIALRTKSGEIIICLVSVELIELQGQSCLVAVARNITDRKKAEEEIKQFKITLDQTLDCVFIFNPKTLKFFYVNKGAVNQVGYTKEELLNMTPLDIQPEYTEEIFRKMIVPLLDESKSSHIFETVHKHNNGELIPVEVSLQYVALPNEAGRFIAIVRNIADRKKVEKELKNHRQHLEKLVKERTNELSAVNKALKESEHYNRMLFDQTTIGLALCRMNGELVDVNPAYAQIIGHSVEETMRLTYWEITPDKYAEDEQRQLESLNMTARYGPYEKEYIHKDGHLVPVCLQGVLLEKDGEQMIWSSAEEITERKQMEEELKKSHCELERRVVERTAELSKANIRMKEQITEREKAEEELKEHRKHLEELVKERTNELSVANKELEAFSYSVSHDLRTPLRAIDGFSQALLEDYFEKLDESGRDYLRRVRAASQHMGELIDDLLTLSRVTRSEIRRKTIDLSILTRSIANELQKKQPDRRAEFVIQGRLIVEADANLLRVVIENLYGNAWKFTGKKDKALIEFGANETDGETIYYVSDNGAGFDMQYADKLFSPFQRLHKVEEFPGTGVGLATVQRIIHRHGGRVWAKGEVDKGATFYFTL